VARDLLLFHGVTPVVSGDAGGP